MAGLFHQAVLGADIEGFGLHRFLQGSSSVRPGLFAEQ
jgi:hypothetical protein